MINDNISNKEAVKRALADASNRLLDDPEYVAGVMEDIRKTQYFIDDLNKIGLSYESIYQVDADNKLCDKRIVSIIADHLLRPYNDWGIVFLLTNILIRYKNGTGASAVPALIKLFVSKENNYNKWQIADTIAFICNDSNYEELKPLILDKSYGKDREMLVYGLKNIKKTPEVVDFLILLLDDEDTYGHAIAALYKLKAVKAKPYFELFKNDKKTFVRNDARKALLMIEKLEAKS